MNYCLNSYGFLLLWVTMEFQDVSHLLHFLRKKLTMGILPNTSEKLMGQNWSISALYSRGKVLQYKKAFVCMPYVGIQPLYI